MRRALRCVLVFLIVDCSMVIFRGYAGATASVASSFESYEVMSDVVPVAPTALACVVYPSGAEARLGDDISPDKALVAPTVTYDAAPGQYYTLAMVDPDVPSRALPLLREFRHWLVANIPGDHVRSGDELSSYLPPTPPPSSGRHRYVFLVYQQPGRIQFDEEALLSLSAVNRTNFSIAKFAEKYNLGNPIAGNFYQSSVLKDLTLL